MTDAIVLDRVSKTYDGRAVLAETSLAIAKGRFVALVGGSGAGKTTLLKLMNGLSTPSAGRVLVEGADIADRRDPAVQPGRAIREAFGLRERRAIGRRPNGSAAKDGESKPAAAEPE